MRKGALGEDGPAEPSTKTLGGPCVPSLPFQSVFDLALQGATGQQVQQLENQNTLLLLSSRHFAPVSTAVTCCPQHTIVSSSVVIWQGACVFASVWILNFTGFPLPTSAT